GLGVLAVPREGGSEVQTGATLTHGPLAPAGRAHLAQPTNTLIRYCRSQPARFRLALIPRLCPLARCKRFRAIWRNTAKFWAPFSLRIRQSSSRNETSRTQCSEFSTPQCSRTALANCVASQGRDVKEYRVSSVLWSPTAR